MVALADSIDLKRLEQQIQASQSKLERELAARYIELSVKILSSEPEETSKNEGEDPLRRWAVDLINEYSDVKMSEAAQDRLLNQPFGEATEEAVREFQSQRNLLRTIFLLKNA